MIFVDDIKDLEFYHNNPVYGCYHDIIAQPSDIILQAQIGTSYDLSLPTIAPVVKVWKPNGTDFLEDASAYFAMSIVSIPIAGVTYYYANVVCRNFSPAMINNACFILELIVPKTVTVNYFDKFTQAYTLLNPALAPSSGVVITVSGSDNLARLCYSDPFTNSCTQNLKKMVWLNDCIEDFNGDFYGDGNIIYTNSANPVKFVRLTNIEGIINDLPKNVKRTISINCRTQRAETTKRYKMQCAKPFPQWKMEEIEEFLLANHLFIDGKEYQSDGGTPFTQYGVPQQCLRMYKMDMDLQDCFMFQDFGCTPVCEPAINYYPIFF